MGRKESVPFSPSRTRTPPPPTALTASPPPHHSPSCACQVLQITTHANKSLETRMANVGLLWRPTPGAGSPGGQPVAQVCSGESRESQNSRQRGQNVMHYWGVVSRQGTRLRCLLPSPRRWPYPPAAC